MKKVTAKRAVTTSKKVAPVVNIPSDEREQDHSTANTLAFVIFLAVANDSSKAKPVSLESPCGTL